MLHNKPQIWTGKTQWELWSCQTAAWYFTYLKASSFFQKSDWRPSCKYDKEPVFWEFRERRTVIEPTLSPRSESGAVFHTYKSTVKWSGHRWREPRRSSKTALLTLLPTEQLVPPWPAGGHRHREHSHALSYCAANLIMFLLKIMRVPQWMRWQQQYHTSL